MKRARPVVIQLFLLCALLVSLIVVYQLFLVLWQGSASWSELPTALLLNVAGAVAAVLTLWSITRRSTIDGLIEVLESKEGLARSLRELLKDHQRGPLLRAAVSVLAGGDEQQRILSDLSDATTDVRDWQLRNYEYRLEAQPLGAGWQDVCGEEEYFVATAVVDKSCAVSDRKVCVVLSLCPEQLAESVRRVDCIHSELVQLRAVEAEAMKSRLGQNETVAESLATSVCVTRIEHYTESMPLRQIRIEYDAASGIQAWFDLGSASIARVEIVLRVPHHRSNSDFPVLFRRATRVGKLSVDLTALDGVASLNAYVMAATSDVTLPAASQSVTNKLVVNLHRRWVLPRSGVTFSWSFVSRVQRRLVRGRSHVSRSCLLELDADRLRANVRAVGQAAAGVKVMSVLKSNAYGIGLSSIGSCLVDAEVDWFGVGEVSEAQELRQLGVTQRILVFQVGNRSLTDRLRVAVENDLTLSVWSYEMAFELDRLARRLDTTVDVHLKIDTGLCRLGVRTEEAVQTLGRISELERVHLSGAFTHIGCDLDSEYYEEQLERVTDCFEQLTSMQPDLLLHAGSTRHLKDPRARFGMVRVGGALFGLQGSTSIGCTEVVTLHSAVVELKRLKAGDRVSYEGRVVLQRDTQVALIPVGYVHGLRAAGWDNGARVLIGSHPCKVLGLVGMDLMIVDVEDWEVRRGDRAYVIHPDRAKLDELARALAAGPYELLTALGTGTSLRLTQSYGVAS